MVSYLDVDTVRSDVRSNLPLRMTRFGSSIAGTGNAAKVLFGSVHAGRHTVSSDNDGHLGSANSAVDAPRTGSRSCLHRPRRDVILNSAAPMRVHILALIVLALAILAPSLWSTTRIHAIDRLKICAGCAFVGIGVWDATAHMVISKAEPFFVLREAWFMYPVVIGALTATSFGLSWLAQPLPDAH